MKSNKGFMRFEVLTIFVFIICIIAVGLFLIIKKGGSMKFDTMKNNAVSLSKAVSNNKDSFDNFENVYLQEVIDQHILNAINNPFGKGNCDASQSKIQYINGLPYATLKCGEYLIDKSKLNNVDDIKIFDVSEWTTKELKGDHVETTVLYNCSDGSKNLFDHDYEPLYLVYLVNKKFGSSNYNLENISECTPVATTYYRTKKAID